MADQQGPLTDEDLAAIKENLARLDEAERIVDQAIRGGIDMQAQKKQTTELRTQLKRIQQSFFPGR
jgi:CRISPR/Cas system-associated endoribonuclease Cas2